MLRVYAASGMRLHYLDAGVAYNLEFIIQNSELIYRIKPSGRRLWLHNVYVVERLFPRGAAELAEVLSLAKPGAWLCG